MPWSPIRYREFYDVARMFLVERAGTTYLFDGHFDVAADKYPDRYRVYRLAPAAAAEAREGGSDWTGLERAGSFIGEVLVADVPFDATLRAAIDDVVFDRLPGGSAPAAAP